MTSPKHKTSRRSSGPGRHPYAKPVSAALLGAGASWLLGGMPMGEALLVGASTGGAVYVADMAGDSLRLQGTTRVIATGAIAGSLMAFATPVIGIRSYRILGQNALVSNVIRGGAIGVGAEYLAPTIATQLQKVM